MADQNAKFMIKLDWKEFNVSLPSVDAWMKANVGAHYCGNQAHAHLELWFTEEPDQTIKDDVQAYWDLLETGSEEATSYKSQEDLSAEKETKKASGKAKLIGLGLTEDEANALLG